MTDPGRRADRPPAHADPAGRGSRDPTDADAAVRRTAAAQLSGDEQGIPGLIAALQDDPDPEVRREAAWSLANTGSETVLLTLTEALQDPDADVRRLAAEFLLCHRSPSTDRYSGMLAGLQAYLRARRRVRRLTPRS